MGVSKMKVCPYCGEDIGNKIYETNYEIFDEGNSEMDTTSYTDYIVECPNCDSSFHWIDIYQRISTLIENADTRELTEYKESE